MTRVRTARGAAVAVGLALSAALTLATPAAADRLALTGTSAAGRATPNTTPNTKQATLQAATQITAVGGQRIVGVPRYTHVLGVRAGRYSVAGAVVSVQWRTRGADLAGETGSTYRIRPQDVGHRLLAVLTVSAPGYDDLTVVLRSRPVRYRIDARRTVTYSVRTRGRITASVARFREQAQETYDDARGWRSSGIRFVPVARGGSFTLVLAQASLVPSYSSTCSSQWSCRVGRYVIINQDRWQHASPAWNAAHEPLSDYRHMVVNHETGHWLGLGHAPCPGPGRLAPVMMQQSKGLDGCRFNPWPLPGEIAGRTPSAHHAARPVIDYARVQVE